jgi:hypothetical protein
MKRWASVLPLAAAAGAWGHEGHGMPDASHWHASDTFGLALVVALAALALWWSARK